MCVCVCVCVRVCVCLEGVGAMRRRYEVKSSGIKGTACLR